jgi:hypothetical protein
MTKVLADHLDTGEPAQQRVRLASPQTELMGASDEEYRLVSEPVEGNHDDLGLTESRLIP